MIRKYLGFTFIGNACCERIACGRWRLFDHIAGTFQVFDTWNDIKAYVKQNKLDK